MWKLFSILLFLAGCSGRSDGPVIVETMERIIFTDSLSIVLPSPPDKTDAHTLYEKGLYFYNLGGSSGVLSASGIHIKRSASVDGGEDPLALYIIVKRKQSHVDNGWLIERRMYSCLPHEIIEMYYTTYESAEYFGGEIEMRERSAYDDRLFYEIVDSALVKNNVGAWVKPVIINKTSVSLPVSGNGKSGTPNTNKP